MGNSIIYNYFFKGLKDWRSFDAGIMEKVIALNMVLGVIANLTWNQDMISIYQGVFAYSTLYFIVGPLFAYYRTFKTDECSYIFITPIKKVHVLFTTLALGMVGFMVFIAGRVLIALMHPSFVEAIGTVNFVNLFVEIINLAMIIGSGYAIIIATDIITVVKKIPRLITYPIAFGLLISRIYMPDFLVYYGDRSYDFIGFFFNSIYSTGVEVISDTKIVLGPNLITFIVSIAILLYALSIFEEYNGERSKGFIKKYIIKD